MEILDNQYAQEPGKETGLHVTRAMRFNWRSTAKWALFLAIVSLVLSGISLLAAGAMIPMMTSMMELGGNPEMAEFFSAYGPYITVVTVVATVITVAIYYFLLRFANDLQKALQFNDQDQFESSWRFLRYHYRILGILVIAYIALYIIAIIFMASFVASRPDM